MLAIIEPNLHEHEFDQKFLPLLFIGSHSSTNMTNKSVVIFHIIVVEEEVPGAWVALEEGVVHRDPTRVEEDAKYHDQVA